jgi:hypothetical protein
MVRGVNWCAGGVGVMSITWLLAVVRDGSFTMVAFLVASWYQVIFYGEFWCVDYAGPRNEMEQSPLVPSLDRSAIIQLKSLTDGRLKRWSINSYVLPYFCRAVLRSPKIERAPLLESEVGVGVEPLGLGRLCSRSLRPQRGEPRSSEEGGVIRELVAGSDKGGKEPRTSINTRRQHRHNSEASKWRAININRQIRRQMPCRHYCAKYFGPSACLQLTRYLGLLTKPPEST